MLLSLISLYLFTELMMGHCIRVSERSSDSYIIRDNFFCFFSGKDFVRAQILFLRFDFSFFQVLFNLFV